MTVVGTVEIGENIVAAAPPQVPVPVLILTKIAHRYGTGDPSQALIDGTN